MTTDSNNYYSKHFDERQLIDRYKISSETMMLTFILIFISGFIKIFIGPWAAANTEMAVLVFIPTTYFLIRAVMKGAYFSVRLKSYTWSLFIFAIIGLANLGNFIVQLMKDGMIIENGMLSETLFPLFLSMPFLFLVLTCLIKMKMTKNDDEDEDGDEDEE